LAFGIGLQLASFTYQLFDCIIRQASVPAPDLRFYCCGDLENLCFTCDVERFNLLQNFLEWKPPEFRCAELILPYVAQEFHLQSRQAYHLCRAVASGEPPDEARYQNYNLPAYPSVMSNAQPLVPEVYGNVQREINEGAGGLSGAPTDLARLIAIPISQQDNPAVTRATIPPSA
jgi:hypothetical protein